MMHDLTSSRSRSWKEGMGVLLQCVLLMAITGCDGVRDRVMKLDGVYFDSATPSVALVLDEANGTFELSFPSCTRPIVSVSGHYRRKAAKLLLNLDHYVPLPWGYSMPNFAVMEPDATSIRIEFIRPSDSEEWIVHLQPMEKYEEYLY